jgi:hypothetical protein
MRGFGGWERKRLTNIIVNNIRHCYIIIYKILTTVLTERFKELNYGE